MGLYGSPDLQEPPNVPRNTVSTIPVRAYWNTCKCCYTRFVGYYCPNCGTRVGEKSPKRLTTGKIILLLILGAFLGIALLAVYSIVLH